MEDKEERFLEAWRSRDGTTIRELEEIVDIDQIRTGLGIREWNHLQVYFTIRKNLNSTYREAASILGISNAKFNYSVDLLKNEGLLSLQLEEEREPEYFSDKEIEILNFTKDNYDLSLREIGEHFDGIDKGLVSNILRKFGYSRKDEKMKRKGEERLRDRKCKASDRQKEIFQFAKDNPELSLKEIGENFEGMSHQSVSYILNIFGYSIRNLRRMKKEARLSLKAEHQKLVDILEQHYFDRLIEEKGLDYALAYRVQEKIGKGRGRKIERSKLAEMIRLRREGNSYLKCIRLSEHKTTTREIRNAIPGIGGILTTALHDLPYKISTRKFGEGRSLSTKEEEEFKEMYLNKTSHKDIAAYFGMPLGSVSYHRRRLGIPLKLNKLSSKEK